MIQLTVAWLISTMPNRTVKDQTAPNDFFYRKTTNKIFMYLLALFILQNFKKVPELRGCAIFRSKMDYWSWTKFFLVQTIIITFIYLLALFIGQNFKKILTADPELWGCAIFRPKMVYLPKTKFFGKLLISLSSTY